MANTPSTMIGRGALPVTLLWVALWVSSISPSRVEARKSKDQQNNNSFNGQQAKYASSPSKSSRSQRPLLLASTSVITPEFSISEDLLQPPVPPTTTNSLRDFVLDEDTILKEDEAAAATAPLRSNSPVSAAPISQSTRPSTSTGVGSGNLPGIDDDETSRPITIRRINRPIPPIMNQVVQPFYRHSMPSIPNGHARVDVELQSSASSGETVPARRASWRELVNTEKSQTTVSDASQMEVSFDLEGLSMAIESLLGGISSLGSAFLGTLRLLAPIIFARRILAYMAYVMSDWYTGRYLRKRYEALDHNYWRYYQIPAALRSLGRILAQLALTMTAGRLLEWILLEKMSYPCGLMESGGCEIRCGLGWICFVLIVGQAVGWLFETCNSPLGIQEAAQITPRQAHKILLKPWSLLQFLRDPDSFLRPPTKAHLRPFNPNPSLYPSTWQLFRILQMIAIALQMPNSAESMHSMMRQLAIQEALRSEWYRVLMIEKRVALGMAAVAAYGMSTLVLFFCVGEVDGTSAILLLPSLFPVMVSGWMNVFVYSERRIKRREDSRRLASG